VSNIKSLPVPAEFVEALQDTAEKTLHDAMRALKVPQNIIELVESSLSLSYYLMEVYRAPETLMKDRRDRFDIEEVVLESVNAISKCGGTFYGPIGSITPESELQEEKSKRVK
jgi:hypothetical protein